MVQNEKGMSTSENAERSEMPVMMPGSAMGRMTSSEIVSRPKNFVPETAAAQSVAMEDRVEELRQDSVILRMQTAVRWRGELARLRQELSDLWTEEAAGVVEVEKLAITAPAAGVLDEIAGLSRGSFVPAGQPIGTLTPASPVVAELYVRPDELDAIHLGSPVRLQLASRRFTRGGTVRGSVVEIQPELVRASQGSAGRILVAPRWPVGPETPAERRTGRANELRRGSTVIARIPVARRSLWALVLRRGDHSTGGHAVGQPSGEPTVE